MTSTPPAVHLCVGEVVLSVEPAVISTVLGSCVSVCLFSNDKTSGGMVHYSLPRPEHGGVVTEDLRYASFAIPRLVSELVRISGKTPAEFSAKIIGGACEKNGSVTSIQVGPRNIAIGRSLLAEFGIRIVGESVGGHCGRKAIFHVPSGRLQVAKIARHSGESETSGSYLEHSPTPAQKAISTLNPRSEKRRKRRVLIIDDSKTIRDLLQRILETDPDLEVVGSACDGFEADRLTSALKPDVITLDVHMPGMTGVEWLEKSISKLRTPVVMITSLHLQEGNEVFRALELGAVDYIQKPSFADLKQSGSLICEKIREASYAKVIRHPRSATRSVEAGKLDTSGVLALGASTGGTEALKSVLCALPELVPPIVIVQHIPPVFSKAFADRMNQLCAFEVKEAEDGDELKPSLALVAPGGKQMKIERTPKGYCVRITDDPPVNRHKPSVDYLFHSVAEHIGKRAVGVILTGMGNDGAAGLRSMRDQGARTLGQDEASSVVYGMPRIAFETGAVESVASLHEIPKLILSHLTGRSAA